MFRVLDLGADGKIQLSEGTGSVGTPPKGVIRWIDLAAQDDAQLALLRDRFNFHPLTIEDCAHFDQRPKLEEYGDYLFIVVHGFHCIDNDPTRVEALEVHAFLGERYLVTVHAHPVPPLEAVWKRAAGDPALVGRGADFLYYMITDAIVDDNFQLLDLLSDALDDVEDAVLGRAEQRDLAHIFELKRTLTSMRRVLSPQRDVFALLAKRGDPRISERTSVYFRDVYDHLVRIYESIDTGRDLLGNALDAYLSMVANKTNEIMKRLTLVSLMFLPITFLTGFFGQNFEHMPFKSLNLMYVVLAACVVIPVGMLTYFRRKRWF